MGVWLRRFLAGAGNLCNNPAMQSKKLSPLRMPRVAARRRAARRAYEAVRISSGLIAFYPVAIHRPQPYVILLDLASGILRRLNLQAQK
jgi:hypothetical protein